MLESIAPRWKKLLADVAAERGRLLMMLIAVSVSLAALGAILGSHAILGREIATSYLETKPAHATLELPRGVDAATLAAARAMPEIGAAEARDVLPARVRVRGQWRPLLLFVVEDFDTLELSRFRSVAGAWPAKRGTVLLERSAADLLAAPIGSELLIRTTHGVATAIEVSGFVHDPALAPAWQEQTGYAYITRADLALLGEAPLAHELRIVLADASATRVQIEAVARRLARSLGAAGQAVHEIRIPPPREHPHQRQMTTMLFLLLSFSVLALLLSAVLVANSLAAMLARQVREIAIMKTLGARAREIALLYASLVALLGAAAALPALPLGAFAAHVLGAKVSVLLNFELRDTTVPHWVMGAQVIAGTVLPLLFAFGSLRDAAGASVSAAMHHQGAAGATLRSFAARLPRPLREALRRPARLALTMVLLGVAGALFMSALNVAASWDRMIAKVYQTRHYDVELRFQEAQAIELISGAGAAAGVKVAEAWGFSPAAFARKGEIDVVASYPDRGHGSFVVMAPPPDTRLISLPVRSGRWLRTDDTDAVVLNHSAAAQKGNPRLGEAIELSIDGRISSWTLVGVVEEIGAAGVAYVRDQSFAAAQGSAGRARLLRIAFDGKTPLDQGVAQISRGLDAAGTPAQSITPLAALRTAMSEHIRILIVSLIALALVMATVGALGLASAMGTSVLERGREFAVMKTLGATPQRIIREVVAQALAIASLSAALAFLLALPLTALIDQLVGGLGFIAPLPFSIDGHGVMVWLLLVVLLAPLASYLAARRAARPGVAAALAVV